MTPESRQVGGGEDPVDRPSVEIGSMGVAFPEFHSSAAAAVAATSNAPATSQETRAAAVAHRGRTDSARGAPFGAHRSEALEISVKTAMLWTWSL